MRLKIAKSLGTVKLEIKNDSQLVVNQVNEDYQANKDGMITYMKKAKELIGQFKHMNLQ